MSCGAQVVNVLGFSLPFYRSPTLLLSLGLSVRVLYFLITQRPDVIHVSSPGLLVFAATLYAKLLAIPLVVSHSLPGHDRELTETSEESSRLDTHLFLSSAHCEGSTLSPSDLH